MRRRMQESSKGAINHEKLKLPTQVTKIGQNFPKNPLEGHSSACATRPSDLGDTA